jgi:hypothetical protein
LSRLAAAGPRRLFMRCGCVDGLVPRYYPPVRRSRIHPSARVLRCNIGGWDQQRTCPQSCTTMSA